MTLITLWCSETPTFVRLLKLIYASLTRQTFFRMTREKLAVRAAQNLLLNQITSYSETSVQRTLAYSVCFSRNGLTAIQNPHKIEWLQHTSVQSTKRLERTESCVPPASSHGLQRTFRQQAVKASQIGMSTVELSADLSVLVAAGPSRCLRTCGTWKNYVHFFIFTGVHCVPLIFFILKQRFGHPPRRCWFPGSNWGSSKATRRAKRENWMSRISWKMTKMTAVNWAPRTTPTGVVFE